MSRYDVVDLPLALPGKCLQCGANTNKDGRKYIQINSDLHCNHGHPYGTLYICEHCLAEIAVAIGFMTRTNTIKMLQEYSDLVKESNRLEDENGHLHRAIRELAFLYPASDNSSDSTTEEPYERDSASDESTERQNSESKGAIEDATGTESGLSESNNERGHSGIHDYDILEKLLSGKLE